MMLWLLLTFNVLAHNDCDHCSHVQGDPSHSIEQWSASMLEASQNLSWWSASPAQVLAAPCREKVPSDQEMLQWMKAQDSAANVSRNLYGLKLENESPENVQALKHLLTARDERGDADPANQLSFNSTCRDVLCVVRDQFGPSGVMMLYMQRRFGFNASHLAYPRSVLWKRDELAQGLMAIQDFPNSTFPQWESRPFTRFLPGELPNASYGSTTVADSIVRFFDRWAGLPVGEQQATATHELGHALAAESGIDRSPEWMALSSWEVKTSSSGTQYYSAQNKNALVSGYSGTSPVEDFAESVVAYRYNPSLLKSRSPQKYDFIRHTVFDGVEYTSAAACQNPQFTTRQLAQEVAPRLQQWNPSSTEVNKLARDCLGDVWNAMGSGSAQVINSAEVKGCLQAGPERQAREWMEQSVANRPWGEFMGPMIKNADINVPANVQSRMNEAGSNLGKHIRQTMAQALTGAFQAYAPSINAARCESADFSESYRYFNSVYQTSPNDPQRYYARFDIAEAVKRICVDIVRSRSNQQALAPAKASEINDRLKAMFP